MLGRAGASPLPRFPPAMPSAAQELSMPMGEGAEFVAGQCSKKHLSDERVRIFSEVYALA